MAGDWIERSIADLGEVVGGSTPSTRDPSNFDGAVPWLTPKDLSGPHDRYVRRGERNLTEKGLASCSARLLPANSVLLSSRAPIGYVAIAANPIATNQGFRSLVLREGVDPGFVYYWLKANTEVLERHSSGSTFKELSGSAYKQIRVRLPSDVHEQRAIARVLGGLDDKIELNGRMSETLDAVGRALFKSWFVDFDPVRAKVEGRHGDFPKHITELFPDSFNDSELGEIPKGWRTGRFIETVEHLRVQENPLDSPEDSFHHFSLPAFDAAKSASLEYGRSIKSLKWRVPARAVLLSKLNPEIERVWFVDARPDERAVCSTEFLVLAARPPFTLSFVYCLARSPLFRRQIGGLVTGTSKSHQRAQVDSILSLPVVIPPVQVIAAFDRTAQCLFARTLECRRESVTLAALRDSLLPRLVSGQLRLREPARFISR